MFVLLSLRRRGRTIGVSLRRSPLRSSFKSRMPGCQPGDAGAIPADRTNFFTWRAPACASKSPKLCLLGAAPRRRANSSCGVAKWEGSGLISRLRAGSIPAPASTSRAGLLRNGNFVRQAGSIDSLSPESSPLRASSMSLGSRRLHSFPRQSFSLGCSIIQEVARLASGRAVSTRFACSRP